jgi:phosphoribosylformylglycinamidine synthase
MKEVVRFARDGGVVWGICNGFQILLEAGLLPGAMLRNKSLRFVCSYVNLRVETTDTIITGGMRRGDVLRIPIAHSDGNYYVDRETLDGIIERDEILFRYCTTDGDLTEDANPNGSIEHIAGICNRERNVFGMMPHPERCTEPILGSDDGLKLFLSAREHFSERLMV